MSYADLERMPEDGRRFELYDGELFEMPSPTHRHQRVVLNAAEVLREYERAATGEVVFAPFDIVLTPYDVVQPDVVYFLPERASRLVQLGPARVPPDLAVEVLSPSTSPNDRGRKMHLLARHEVREYWLIDPIDHWLEQHVLGTSGYELHAVVSEIDELASGVLPGFRCAGERLFRP